MTDLDIEADYEPEGLDLDFTVFDDHLDESAYESIQDPYEEEFSTQRLFKQIQAASQTVTHPTETTEPSFPDTVEYGPPREQGLTACELGDEVTDELL